jgi:hypothetical protein
MRRLSVVATGQGSAAARVRFKEVLEEAGGPLRATVVAKGDIRWKGGQLALEARIHTFAAVPVVRLEIAVENRRRAVHQGGFWELGDPGSVLYEDISIRADLNASPLRTVCYVEPTLPPVATSGPVSIYQDSSGGENWQSTVHLNREGKIPHRFRGYVVNAGDQTITTGLRATPVVLVEDAGGITVACVQHFWQNFPKAIEVDTSGISIRLFPRQFGDLHELQGGERKTHVMGLAFGPDPVGDPPLSWVLAPSVVTASPDWYVASDAVPYLTPVTRSTEREYEALVGSAFDDSAGFEQKRERVDEYGWRNFGDLYADHEAVRQQGQPALVSHYNNQYDAIAGFATQFMRSRDLRWWGWMEELAAHVADIDIYHTQEDKAAYNGGLFWHTAHYTDAGRSTHRTYPSGPGAASGGPSNEHNYSTGLMLHYFLTGRGVSRDAVLGLAEWVLAMDDGHRTPFRWLASGETGLASSTVSSMYHGPGRGAGNSIATLLNAYRLSSDHRFLDKAEALIARSVHPSDDLDALKLLDAERRWSYTVFLQVLGRYLDEKAERHELDWHYEYARRSLLHYARWMAAHEYRFLEKPEILEFPTETWTAQDIRKAEVLVVAARHTAGEERARLLDRAEYFFRRTVVSLSRSPTRSLTRPVVILLSNGHSYSALRRAAIGALAVYDQEMNFGSPMQFVPQRLVATRRAILWGSLSLAATTIALLGYVVFW